MIDPIAGIIEAGICGHELRETSRAATADGREIVIERTCDQCGYDIVLRLTPADEFHPDWED